MSFIQYFQSYKDYFWSWEDEGEVLCIPGGSTIAYKEFAAELLSDLQPQGIPPFGSLLLFIIATNNTAQRDIELIAKIISLKHKQATNLHEAFTFLHILQSLPAGHKRGKRRVQLMQTLFENCHNRTNEKKAAYIIKSLSKIQKTSDIPQEIELQHQINWADFQTIALLLRKFPDAQSILQKIAGLPAIEDEIILEENLLTDTEHKDFVDLLVENNKTFHIGALIKRIWSGLNIPFHNILPSSQPMGGVSDLTNKGDFDRLLISEFANDDLVFLSRLANNEALYINREVPPQDNNLERIILIDGSIKNWGIPKTIAHALAIAIAKHPKTNIHCAPFVVGNEFQPFQFNTIDEIIDSLQLLDPCMDASEGLEKFCKAFKEKKQVEVIFIASKESVSNISMQRILSEYNTLFNYHIYTDREGNIDLYKKQHNSKKHIQHILLPLTDLWKNEKKNEQTGKQEKNEEADKENYPLLLPVLTASVLHLLNITYDWVFAITKERQLLEKQNAETKRYEKGWKMINDNLGFFVDTCEIGELLNDDVILLIFNTQRREIALFNLITGEKKTVIFSAWQSSDKKHFHFHVDAFYYFPSYRYEYYKINAISGEITAIKAEQDPVLLRNYNLRRSELETLNNQKRRYFNQPVLRNVKEVFINEENKLIFNKHALCIKNEAVIKLELTKKLQKKYEAKETEPGKFVFSNGNSVRINAAGMFVLQNAICEPSYALMLNNAGSNKLEAVRLLKNHLSVSLQEAKELVDGTPSLLLHSNEKGIVKKMYADIMSEFYVAGITDVDMEIVEQNKHEVFIASVIDISTAVATNKDKFAGNEYFYNSTTPLKAGVFWNLYINPFLIACHKTKD